MIAHRKHLMIPPDVETLFPSQGGSFTDGVIVIRGSLVGLIFAAIPPQVWDLDTGAEVPIHWQEEEISAWYAEAPDVGAEIRTEVRIHLPAAIPGREYRLRYPVSDCETRDAILTACASQPSE